MATRCDNRTNDELRPLELTLDYQFHPAGSVLIRCGQTRVICSVSITEGVPRWMREQGVEGGWLTAEYQMLPGATTRRTEREITRMKPAGRGQEIQRFIGRCLRAAIDLTHIPGRTIYVDCDVLDADGGTRCAAVTGAAAALETALHKLFLNGAIKTWPLLHRIAAVSVGIVDGSALLDLCYEEDVAADVDMNVVMTADGRFVEIQGTAEDTPFSREQADELLGLAEKGLQPIFECHKATLRAGAMS